MTVAYLRREDATLTSETTRRLRAARNDAIRFAICYTLSHFAPPPWGFYCWWMAVAIGAVALWNLENWNLARLQARETAIYLTKCSDVLPAIHKARSGSTLT